MTETLSFQSEKSNLANVRVERGEVPQPATGEVVIRVVHFALTANNITYGVAGDTIGYWQFFPTPNPDWGNIPVWGFGEVVASAHSGVSVGQRVYGYFPMATHVVLQPDDVRAHGFVDAASHRSKLPGVYNQYTFTATDPAYQPDREAEQMLYRPLFTTSFLIDDFLADNNFFGASHIILTSASSKTSLGLAFLLSRRGAGRCQVVGLTSAANRAFVEGLGCYDLVLTYADLGQLPREPSVMVDMAGSGQVRAGVHETLEDLLQYSCAVGATHWQDATVGGGQVKLPGPKPVMFFAPSQGAKRIEDWGRAGYEVKLADAWQGFLSAASHWISVQQCEGEVALNAVYSAFIAGEADPAKGYVVSL